MQVTFAPWTGTANPWTGTANPWTGTSHQYTGPAHPATDPPKPPTRKPTSKPTPAPTIPGEHCYSFTCKGYYDECYRLHGPSDVCGKKLRYCKVSVYQDRNGTFSVKASCVRRNCKLTHGPGVTYGCCNTHLCNNEHLLTFKRSSAHRSASPGPSSLALVMVTAVCWIMTPV
ncbi:hypothetical protein ACOMHN_003478 [Nucella lapillus]